MHALSSAKTSMTISIRSQMMCLGDLEYLFQVTNDVFGWLRISLSGHKWCVWVTWNISIRSQMMWLGNLEYIYQVTNDVFGWLGIYLSGHKWCVWV